MALKSRPCQIALYPADVRSRIVHINTVPVESLVAEEGELWNLWQDDSAQLKSVVRAAVGARGPQGEIQMTIDGSGWNNREDVGRGRGRSAGKIMCARCGEITSPPRACADRHPRLYEAVALLQLHYTSPLPATHFRCVELL